MPPPSDESGHLSTVVNHWYDDWQHMGMARRIVRTTAALAAAALVAPAAALGHSLQFESMRPADGATLDSPSAEVEVTYSGPFEMRELEVRMPSGSIERPEVRVDGATARFTVPPVAAPGRITMVWHVPNSDGHVVRYQRVLIASDAAVDPRARDVRAAVAAMLGALRSARSFGA